MSDKIEPRELSPEQRADIERCLDSGEPPSYNRLVLALKAARKHIAFQEQQIKHGPWPATMQHMADKNESLKAQLAASLPGDLARELLKRVRDREGIHRPISKAHSYSEGWAEYIAAVEAAEAHLDGHREEKVDEL